MPEEWTDRRLDDFASRTDKRMDGVEGQTVDLRGKMNARFDKVDARFDKVDARFDQMDAKVDARFSRMDDKIDSGFDQINARFDQINARFDSMQRALFQSAVVLAVGLLGVIATQL